MHCWVIGRGGLLGSSVEKRLITEHDVWAPLDPIIWKSFDAFQKTFEPALKDFKEFVGLDPWIILWCAGVGTVSTTADLLNDESLKIESVLLLAKKIFGELISNGTLFFASSAGGVYAGSASPPMTESTEVRPLSIYGFQKLRLEEMFRQFGRETGATVLIGRIANLFGPLQDIGKGQGLISSICLSVVLRRPVKIFVGLETIRSYIFSEDAAELIVRSLGQLSKFSGGSIVTKIIAARQSHSISSVLMECESVFGHRPLVAISRTGDIRSYPLDLRLESEVFPDIDRFYFTSLAVGIERVHKSLLESCQVGALSKVVNH